MYLKQLNTTTGMHSVKLMLTKSPVKRTKQKSSMHDKVRYVSPQKKLEAIHNLTFNNHAHAASNTGFESLMSQTSHHSRVRLVSKIENPESVNLNVSTVYMHSANKPSDDVSQMTTANRQVPGGGRDYLVTPKLTGSPQRSTTQL